MTLNSKTLAVLVVGILFGGIILSATLGWWQTESTKQAAKFTSGEFAGQANPDDIRGSYTFGDVENNFGIPVEVLGEAFGVTGDAASFQVKNLEAISAESGLEIGTSSVRLFVAFYKNLPLDLSTDIYLPESAVKILLGHSLTAEQAAYLEAHTVAAESQAAQPVPAETSEIPPTATHEESSERVIKGKTTFDDLLGWGMTREAIEKITGAPLPNPSSLTIKEYASANNLDFETIKTSLQAEVDALK